VRRLVAALFDWLGSPKAATSRRTPNKRGVYQKSQFHDYAFILIFQRPSEIRGGKMKLTCLTLLLVILLQPASGFAQTGQSQKEVMTNASVIQLSRAGLGDAIIVQKIRQSDHNFDTSSAGLSQLKAAKVSDNIIMEMMSPGAAATAPSASTQNADPAPVNNGNSNDPMSVHDPGIYLMEKTALAEMNPSVFQGTKANFLGTALTYGLKKTKMRAVVRGASANTVTSASRPEFYFYFDKSLSNPGYAMAGFLAFGASSPAEFTMVRMEQKKNTREAVLGEFNAYTSSTGAQDKDIVEFSFEKIRPGVFKVIPKTDLAAGEYCFYFAGTPAGLGFAGGKIFDFSIAKPQ
jgi:hypothetical protein